MEGTYPAGLEPKGYQQITVSTTAIGLTIPAGTIRAIIGVELQPLRYRDDGTNPTSTVGFLKQANDYFEINGPLALANFMAIRSDASDATLNIIYYGQ